jgi:N-acetylmuramoyl-L-alanine amidase
LRPTLVVLHYTAMRSAQAAIERLCDPVAEVSAHYMIARTGEVTQLVDEALRAWHAGAGEWHGQDDINSRSIGIELDNGGFHPFPEAQMSALEMLLSGLLTRWDIASDGVIGHSDMAPGRKIDPGPHFDWARLARQGLAAAEPAISDGDPALAGYTCAASPQDLKQAIALRWGRLGATLRTG